MKIITFCVVAYNSAKVISNLFYDLLAQTYPLKNMEVVLVDGNSTDETKNVMLAFKYQNEDKFARISVLSNPKRTLPCGWNVALKDYMGEAILRVDAHANIPSDFVEKNVRLIEGGERICGGKVISLPANDTLWADTVNAAENSMFGGGFAKFRRSDNACYLDTLAFAMYKREVFNKVGFYNEELARTEDNEMHYRMRQAGYKFFYDPTIISTRTTRASFKLLFKQKYLNGYWIGKTLKVCPRCFSIYHYVPTAFVLGIIITAIFSMFGWPFFLKFMWIAYALAAVLMAIVAFFQSNRKSMYYVLLPFMYFALHVGYGTGTIIGIIWRDN